MQVELSIFNPAFPPRSARFSQNEITIGSAQGNDLVLVGDGVDPRHARVVLRDGKCIVIDLRSSIGTFINGTRIHAPLVVQANDTIQIDDTRLVVSSLPSDDRPRWRTKPQSPQKLPADDLWASPGFRAAAPDQRSALMVARLRALFGD